MRRGTVLAFVEVKSKTGDRFGDPLDMVTAVKADRVRRAAHAWLAAHPDAQRLVVRFDVAAERSGRLEVVQDAL